MKQFRKYIIISVLILFSFISGSPVQAQSARMKDRFYLGAINFYFQYGLRLPRNIGWYSELNYNMMHSFCAHLETQPYEDWGTTQYDGGFFEPYSVYGSYITNAINSWYNISGNNSIVFEREKVLRGCFGQRSTYKVTEPGTWNTKFPGYGYQRTNGITGQDWTDNVYAGGDLVRRCITNTHSPGFIMKDLYDNCEQVNIIDSVDNNANSTNMRLYSDVKERKYDIRWFIKPRIRIDSVYAKSHREDTVCILYINRFDGQLLNSYPILCKNFLLKFGNNYFYNGDYLEMFYHIPPHGDDDNTSDAFNISAWDLKGGYDDTLWHSKVDYYIYWPGYVDMYLQYLRVDDSWAHYLFTDSLGNKSDWKFAQKIDTETVNLANQSGFSYYWLDEIPYNSIPCAEEVNRLIKKYSGNQTSILTFGNLDNMRWRGGLRNWWPNDNAYLTQMNKLFDDNFITNIFVTELYPFQFFIPYPPNVQQTDTINYPTTRYFKRASSTSGYNDTIQYHINAIAFYHKSNINLAKSHQMPYNVNYQVHSDEGNIRPARGPEWGLREPTNEEIRLQSYLCMVYGAKQLYQYTYYSRDLGSDKYTFGLTECPTDQYGTPEGKRYINYYGQAKWDSVVVLNKKMRALGDYMYPEGEISKHLAHVNTVSVNPLIPACSVCERLPHLYLSNLISYYKNNGGTWDEPNTLFDDPENKRFFDVGFFENPLNSLDKYMLLVNKRCVPVQGGYGDERTVRLYISPSSLTGFNNWVLADVMTGDKIVFDKNNISGGVYFPFVFQPGEGKLLKLAPVMQEGGTFVCDESFSDINVNCKADVYTGGYNLIIGANASVEFNENCKITVENCGKLEMNGTSANPVRLKGKSSSKWYGIYANNISEYVLIEHAEFSNIKSGWALTIINCGLTAVSDSKFTLTDYEQSSSVSGIIVNNNSLPSASAYLINNELYFLNSNVAIAVLNNAETGGSGMIQYNTISNSVNGNTGLFLTNTYELVLSDNNLQNCKCGVKAINSSMTLTANTIFSNESGARGLEGTVWSTFQLGNDNFSQYGFNNISDLGNNSMNIKVDHSWFFAWYGENYFNVSENTNSYNLYGNGQFNPYTLSPVYNCFNGPNGNAIYDLTDTLENPLILIRELPHLCEKNDDESIDFAVNHPFGIIDTVYKDPDIIMQNPTQFQILKRNFFVNTTKRNHDSTYIQGLSLLTNFSDSIYAPGVISKLYLSAAADTGTAKIQAIKTFYEQLIVNNSQNVPLVKSANYFIQKCKVRLGQYESALLGFEDIMVQNPYTYEGLLASWDYAATVLLHDTTQGAGGYNSKESAMDLFSSNYELLIDSSRAGKIARYDKYDKSAFTVSERKTLITKTGNVLIDERNKQTEKINELQKKIINKDQSITVNEKREYENMKILHELVKIKKPKNINEYLLIVDSDIKKLNNSEKDINAKESQNVIPDKYELYQNYPNPFNPTTKIAFDLPKDAKVKLIIYDILGREVKTLINNEFRTVGKYVSEFNGSNLASGVYFARILVNDGKEFVAVKKMVLIK